MAPDTEAAMQERIRQMWEANMNIKDIRAVLEDEGYEFNRREYARLRKRNGFTRREGAGYKPRLPSPGKRKRGDDDDGDDGMEADGDAARDGGMDSGMVQAAGGVMGMAGTMQVGDQQPGLSPEEEARRAERLAQLNAKSDEQFHSRKRRRRIRGYGHLPADESGLPPRYRSETSLDECKAFLHLTNDMYQAIRRAYEEICGEFGIERKKGAAEDGRWQSSKDKLIRENMHLSGVMHPLQPDLDQKANALDCLCMDITKRIRDAPKVITVAQANNGLGLNPSASKNLRRAFYEILEADKYTTKLACGDEHFQELRERWIAGSPFLQQVVAEGDPQRLKCVEKLQRDCQKRYGDDRIRADPSLANWGLKTYGPGPGPANLRKPGERYSQPPKAPAPPKPAKKSRQSAAAAVAEVTDPVALDPALVNAYADPIPAYFRLAPSSHIIGHHPRMWLGKIEAPTVASLHKAAASNAGAASVTKAQGVIKNEDGSEVCYQIDVDEELQVYLEAAGAQDKATFVVQLVGGYA